MATRAGHALGVPELELATQLLAETGVMGPPLLPHPAEAPIQQIATMEIRIRGKVISVLRCMLHHHCMLTRDRRKMPSNSLTSVGGLHGAKLLNNILDKDGSAAYHRGAKNDSF